MRLRFPVAASVSPGRDRNAQGSPYASISCGQLLFALPIPDTQGPNTREPGARWNYALEVRGDKLQQDIVVDCRAMPAKWTWPLESPLKLRTSGFDRLEPGSQGPSPARRTDRQARAAADNHVSSLRLQQVPRVDVPDDQAAVICRHQARARFAQAAGALFIAGAGHDNAIGATVGKTMVFWVHLSGWELVRASIRVRAGPRHSCCIILMARPAK